MTSNTNPHAKNLIIYSLRRPQHLYDLLEEKYFFSLLELIELKKAAEELQATITAEIIEKFIQKKLKEEHVN